MREFSIWPSLRSWGLAPMLRPFCSQKRALIFSPRRSDSYRYFRRYWCNIGLRYLRLKEDYSANSSFGFQKHYVQYPAELDQFDKRPLRSTRNPCSTIFGFAFSNPLRYAVCMAFLAACVWIAWRVGESPLGKFPGHSGG